MGIPPNKPAPTGLAPSGPLPYRPSRNNAWVKGWRGLPLWYADRGTATPTNLSLNYSLALPSDREVGS
jgi:hypothetical protein